MTSRWAELRGRLEQATGPDRHIDACIGTLARCLPVGAKTASWIDRNFPDWRGCPDGKIEVVHDDGRGGVRWNSHKYSSSLDAALTLGRNDAEKRLILETVLENWNELYSFQRCIIFGLIAICKAREAVEGGGER